MSTTLLGLVGLLACNPQPAPTEPANNEPANNEPANNEPATNEPATTNAKGAILAPAWGEGSTELRVGPEILGVMWVGPSAPGSDMMVEAAVLFQAPLAADPATRWDTGLDGLDVYPALAPSKADGSSTTVLEANDLLRCTPAKVCTPCDTGTASCYNDLAAFKAGIWGDLAKRLGKPEAAVKNLARELVESTPWDRTDFNVADCTAPGVTEYTPARDNVVDEGGQAVAYLHMGKLPGNKTMVRVVVPEEYQAFPNAYGQEVGWPGTAGPYKLQDWCTEVDGWCTAELNCKYSELTLSYPANW